MIDQNLIELLAKYKEGTCSEEEKVLLENWVSFVTYPDYEISEEEIQNDLAEIKSGLPLVKTRRLWPRIAAAASVILLIGFGFFFLNKNKPKGEEVATSEKQEIVPGSNKAYLTLSDGSRIALTDANNGTLAEQSNVKITKAADGQLVYTALGNQTPGASATYNTIETPKGGMYEISLPDGTHVWLNAASSLKYPASFSSLKERKVELKGEAYFEVAHNAQKPFRVVAAEQTIEVLGTHFNINDYKDNGSSITTLLEGKVKISNKEGEAFLAPGNEAVVANNKITVNQHIDTEFAVAWKNGLFKFKNAKLRDVMQQLGRWYDVDISYKGEIKDRSFSGEITRNTGITEVLDMLRLLKVNFTITNNGERKIITVTPDK